MSPELPKLRLSDPLDDPVVPAAPSNRSVEVSGVVSIPPLLPELNQEDYINIKNWYPTEYSQGRKGRKKGDKDPSAQAHLSSFMEDEDGNPIPDLTRDAARETARGFFAELLSRNSAPASWGGISISLNHSLINLLETQYPFLRLCSNHWKAKQLATNSYSQWYKRNVIKKAAIQTKEEIGKGKGKGKETEESSDAEVIDLDENEQNTGNARSKRPMDINDSAPGPSKRPRIEDPRTTSTSLPRPSRISKTVCNSIYFDYMRTKITLTESIVWIFECMHGEVRY